MQAQVKVRSSASIKKLFRLTGNYFCLQITKPMVLVFPFHSCTFVVFTCSNWEKKKVFNSKREDRETERELEKKDNCTVHLAQESRKLDMSHQFQIEEVGKKMPSVTHYVTCNTKSYARLKRVTCSKDRTRKYNSLEF